MIWIVFQGADPGNNGASISATSDQIVMDIFHYTDKGGWNGIRSQKTWRFVASQPKDPARPVGAYFTDIAPSEENLRTLHKRIRVPRIKQEYVFWFLGTVGRQQHNGGRGRDRRIYYSPTDYDVVEDRQVNQGATNEIKEQLQ